VAIDSRHASRSPGVARLRLSPHRAEPISLVRASKDLLSATAVHGIKFAKGAVYKERFLRVAEGCAL
jgi:hypothetical protein